LTVLLMAITSMGAGSITGALACIVQQPCLAHAHDEVNA